MAALDSRPRAAEDFPAEIAVVVANRADAGGLERAGAAGIPAVVIESKPFGKDRAGFEAALQAALEQHRVELICLAGFMRLFTAGFVQRWYGRCSTSIPRCCRPFSGSRSARPGVACRREGFPAPTVHFVIPETVRPILDARARWRSRSRCRGNAGERVLEIEHRIYPEALRPSRQRRRCGSRTVSARTTATAGPGNFLISPVVN